MNYEVLLIFYLKV